MKITIKRKTHTDNFTLFSNEVHKSFKGKFEASYLYNTILSNQEGFLTSKKQMMTLTGLSERKWKTAIDDLVSMGHLKREKKQNPKTTKWEWEFTFFEVAREVDIQEKVEAIKKKEVIKQKKAETLKLKQEQDEPIKPFEFTPQIKMKIY